MARSAAADAEQLGARAIDSDEALFVVAAVISGLTTMAMANQPGKHWARTALPRCSPGCSPSSRSVPARLTLAGERHPPAWSKLHKRRLDPRVPGRLAPAHLRVDDLTEPCRPRRQPKTWWARGDLNPHVLADTGT